MKLLISLLGLLLFSCSNSVTTAGGTSSSENARIVGIAMRPNGEPSRGASVKVRISRALPGDHNSTYSTVTDSLGRYDIAVPEKNTYSALISDSALVAIRSSITPESGVTLLDTVRNAVTTTLSLTDIEMTGDSIGVMGTDLSLPATIDDNGFVTISSVPPGSFSGLLVDNTPVVQDFVISENETDTLLVSTEEIRPIWRFPLLISVRDEVVAHYGSLDSVRTLLINKYRVVSDYFQSLDLSGHIIFSIDSVESFTGSYTANSSTTPEGYLTTIYYTNEYVAGNSSRALYQSDYYYFSSTAFAFFQDWDTRLAIKLLATRRGAIDHLDLQLGTLSWPIASDGYEPSQSIMYHPDSSDYFPGDALWALERNGRSLSRVYDYLQSDLIQTISMRVFMDDVPVENGAVKLYRKGFSSEDLSEYSTEAQYTDANGVVLYSSDIFMNNGVVAFGNILAVISYGNDTTEYWMPVTDFIADSSVEYVIHNVLF